MSIDEHYRANFTISVKKLSRALGHHNAEDVVQDAYYRILKYEIDPEILDKVFNTILSNCVRQHLRDARMKGMVTDDVRSELEIIDPVDSSPEELLMSSDTYNEITDLILTKKNATFSVLWCFFCLQQSYETIREQHPDISANNMRKIVSEFRKEIRDRKIVE